MISRSLFKMNSELATIINNLKIMSNRVEREHFIE